MAKITIEAWLSGDERRAWLDGHEIDYADDLGVGDWQVRYAATGHYGVVADQYTLVDVEEGPMKYSCWMCGAAAIAENAMCADCAQDQADYAEHVLGGYITDSGEFKLIQKEQSERAEVVEAAIREDELDELRKMEFSLISMLDELRERIREQVERQNANDAAHCDGRAEMEVLAAWTPQDENLGSSSWWLDMPIPFSLSDKGRATLAGGQNA